MRLPYTNEIIELQKWVEKTNNWISAGQVKMTTGAEAQAVLQWINIVANAINDEYPFYAVELPGISKILFFFNAHGTPILNHAAFGELFIIVKQLFIEPRNMQFWINIHPRIILVSKDLYCDGHYAPAAEKAIKEVETRLRELFQELKEGAGVPGKVQDIIGALFSENGIYNFCDMTTVSGKDYRRGIQLLFEGTFAAYLNPAAHENINYTKREAVEQIMLASQLMYVLYN